MIVSIPRVPGVCVFVQCFDAPQHLHDSVFERHDIGALHALEKGGHDAVAHGLQLIEGAVPRLDQCRLGHDSR